MNRNRRLVIAVAALVVVSSIAAAGVQWTPPSSPPAGDYVGTFTFDSGPDDSPVATYIVKTATMGTLRIQSNDPSLNPAKILLLDQGVNENDNNNRVTIDAQGNVVSVATL